MRYALHLAWRRGLLPAYAPTLLDGVWLLTERET